MRVKRGKKSVTFHGKGINFIQLRMPDSVWSWLKTTIVLFITTGKPCDYIGYIVFKKKEAK